MFLKRARVAAMAAAQSASAAQAPSSSAVALRQHLVGMYVRKQLSAKDVCVTAYFATRAGAQGVADMALTPDLGATSQGNYAAHLSRALGRERQRDKQYMADVPLCDKTGVRDVVPLPMRLPTRALLDDFVGDAPADVDMSTPLHIEGDSNPPWTQQQLQHPVVKRALAQGVHLSRIRRVGLYMDAAGYTKNESFEGYFFNDLGTGKKYLVAVVRKLDLCDCGRRGWCSLFHIHWVLKWDLSHGACGVRALVRHDGKPLDDADAALAASAIGRQLGFVIAVVEIRADWPGFVLPMGLRTCSHKSCPCPFCKTTKSNMNDLSRLSLHSGPAQHYTNEEYRLEKRARERCVTVTSVEARRLVLASLHFEKRKRGRALRWDIPELGLLKGDRLTPTETFPGPWLFDVAPLPIVCTFWRFEDDSRMVHASPLMDIEGVEPSSYAIDILHTWSLGPVQRFTAHVFWVLLQSDAWGVRRLSPWLVADDFQHLNLLRLRADMFVYYKRRRTEDPEWCKRGSEVWNLTLKMLGSPARPELNAKAAESNGLLDFAVDLLAKNIEALGDDARGLLEACRSALQVHNIMRTTPKEMTRADAEMLMHAYVRHASLFERAGGRLAPKHHLMAHCVQQTLVHGNPRFHHTYRDESLNGVIAKIARTSARATFASTTHYKFGLLQNLGLNSDMF